MMTGPNCYFRRSRVSARKFRLLLRLFCLDMEATKIAQLTGLNRNSVNLYLRHFRERIAMLCEAESPLRGQVEIDESYFGGRRVRGAEDLRYRPRDIEAFVGQHQDI